MLKCGPSPLAPSGMELWQMPEERGELDKPVVVPLWITFPAAQFADQGFPEKLETSLCATVTFLLL